MFLEKLLWAGSAHWPILPEIYFSSTRVLHSALGWWPEQRLSVSLVLHQCSGTIYPSAEINVAIRQKILILMLTM